MAGLRRHPNVLNLLGYGWDHKAGGVLPFLVTEFAPGGTLRQFLQDHKILAEEKIILCQDVARGLHALHVSGIAHGDLKLDNVLAAAIPENQHGGDESDIPDVQARRFGVVARISDFGHSLRILYNEEAPEDLQRYGGTLIYNAPEVQASNGIPDAKINFRKCDTWALGLLCWETFRDGKPYYHSEFSESIDSAKGWSGPRSTASTHASSSVDIGELMSLSSQFSAQAMKETRKAVDMRLDSATLSKLDTVFRRTLVVDPDRRIADIPFIPLFSRMSATQAVAGTEAPMTTSWTFDIFRAARFLPHYVKEQVLSDCAQIGSEPGSSDLAAKAAFQTAMAFLVGFGTHRDKKEADRWFETSAGKGSLIATSFRPLFIGASSALDTYLSCVRSGFRKVLMSENHMTEDSPWILTEETYKRFDLSAEGITRVTDERGNSALMYACKMGDSEGARRLLELSGKNPDLERHDAVGTNFLHWLFMFPDSDSLDLASRLIKNAMVPVLMLSGDKEDSLIPLIDSPTRAQVDHIVTSPQVLDLQLPLRLQGTPLAFATAANCLEAVKALLHYHADPLCGLVPWQKNVLNESALHVAAKLHLADILDLLLRTVTAARFNLSSGDYQLLINALVRSLPTAYSLERIIIHGDGYRKAAKMTISVLMAHMMQHDIPINLWDFLEPAIEYADLDLAETIADITSVKGKGFQLEDADMGPLIIACTRAACSATFDDTKSVELMKFALRLGSKIDGDPMSERRPINIAIDYHNTLILEWLIEKGADVNIRDSRGWTPVHVLFESDFSSSFGLSQLIDAGANCTTLTNDGVSPLDLAMAKGKCEDVEALLTSRCRDFVLQSTDYQTIFLKAIKLQNPTLASKIVELAYADGQLESIDLSLALCHAVSSRNLELADYLLTLGADPRNETVLEGWATKPIWVAAKSHYEEFLQLAHRYGRLDLEDRSGSDYTILTTVIAYASYEPYDRSAAEAFAFLVEVGAKINAAGSLKMFPLQVAMETAPPIGRAFALMDRLWFVRSLLKAGADPNIVLAWPYQFPVEKYHVVREHGQEIRYVPQEYQNLTPLHYAIIKQDQDLVQLLLDHGASVSHLTSFGRRAVHLAAVPHHYPLLFAPSNPQSTAAIAKTILASESEFLPIDFDNKTALELAIESNNAEVVRAILDSLRDKFHFSRNPLAKWYRLCLTFAWILIELCALPTNYIRLKCFVWVTSILLWAFARFEPLRNTQCLDIVRQFFAKKALWGHTIALRNVRCLVSTRLAGLMAIDSAWEHGIELGHWACVCACIESGLYGLISDLNYPAALQTLRYALEAENKVVLTKFIGSSATAQYSGAGPPDPDFHQFWRTFQDSLTAFPDNVVGRFGEISRAGGYFPVNRIDNLKTAGFVEAQQESGMAQVAVYEGYQQPTRAQYPQNRFVLPPGLAPTQAPLEMDSTQLPRNRSELQSSYVLPSANSTYTSPGKSSAYPPPSPTSYFARPDITSSYAPSASMVHGPPATDYLYPPPEPKTLYTPPAVYNPYEPSNYVYEPPVYTSPPPVYNSNYFSQPPSTPPTYVPPAPTTDAVYPTYPLYDPRKEDIYTPQYPTQTYAPATPYQSPSTYPPAAQQSYEPATPAFGASTGAAYSGGYVQPPGHTYQFRPNSSNEYANYSTTTSSSMDAGSSTPRYGGPSPGSASSSTGGYEYQAGLLRPPIQEYGLRRRQAYP